MPGCLEGSSAPVPGIRCVYTISRRSGVKTWARALIRWRSRLWALLQKRAIPLVVQPSPPWGQSQHQPPRRVEAPQQLGQRHQEPRGLISRGRRRRDVRALVGVLNALKVDPKVVHVSGEVPDLCLDV